MSSYRPHACTPLRGRRPLLPLATLAALVTLAALSASRPAAAQDLAVTGLVLDGNDHPLEGAEVALHRVPTHHELGTLLLSGEAHGETVADARTDAEGRFRIEAPEAGFYTLVVRHPERVPREYHLHPLLDSIDLEAVRLLPDAGLSVQVVDGAGKPVAGAVVDFRGQGPPAGLTDWRPWGWLVSSRRVATTGPRGRAVLHRFEGEGGNLRTAVPGAVTAVELAARDPRRRIRLVLAPSPVRRLRAVGPHGVPVAGVVVWDEPLFPLGTTAEDGTLDVPLPGGLAMAVYLDAADGRVAAAELGPPRGDDKGPQDVVLQPAPEAAGRVVEAGGGEGIAGALVWSTLDPSAAVRSGRGGVFRVPVPVYSGGGELGAAAPGYTSAGTPALDRSGDPVKAAVLALEPAARLSGRVVDGSGRPLPWVEVRVVAADHQPFARRPPTKPGVARTGSDGRFRIGGLPIGTALTVRASLEGYAPWQERVAPRSAVPGQAGSGGFPELEIVLSAGARLRGRLMDETGAPVAAAEVVLTPRDAPVEPWAMEPAGMVRAESGPDGVFVLSDLAAGRVDLSVTAAGHAPLSRPGVEVPDRAGTIDLGDLVLGPEAVLEGVVEDPRGVPIEGVQLRVAADQPRYFRPPTLGQGDDSSRTTGADGRFRFDGLRPGDTVGLHAWKEGYAAGGVDGIVLPTEEPVQVVLEPSAQVSGRVVDEAGRGVAEASVRSSMGSMRRGIFFRPTRSEEDGSFVAEVPPGSVDLVAEKTGYQASAPVLLELEAGETRDGVELVLSPSAVVRGRVLFPEGSPVEGAQVMITTVQSGQGASSHGESTDAEGRFELDAAPGRVRLEAAAEGYASAVRELELTAEGASVELRLGQGTEVSGRVVGPDGEPAPGRRVSLLGDRGLGGRGHQGSSAGDGSFAFRGVENGTYRLQVEVEPTGRGTRSAPYTHPDDIVVDGGVPVSGILVRLPARATLHGRLLGVTPDEMARTTVVARGFRNGRPEAAPGTPLDGGRYEISGLGSGRWEVTAAVAESGKSAQGTVEIAPGQEEAVLDLELREGLTVTGTVRWNGEPAPGVRLQTGRGSWGAGSGTVTGPDGRFRLTGLAPGRQEILLGQPERGLWITRTVEVYGGEDLLFELDTARLRGSVLSATGMEPLAGAVVILAQDPRSAEGESRWRGLTPRTSTAVDGAFLFDDVQLGSYRLQVEKPGYGAYAAPVEVTEGGITLAPLVLEPVGELELRVRGEDGGSIDRVRVRALGADGLAVLDTWLLSAGGGRFVLDTLPPGRWELEVQGFGWGRARVVAVVPGPPVEVVLPRLEEGDEQGEEPE